MTVGELDAICRQKIFEENPLRFPPTPGLYGADEAQHRAAMQQVREEYFAELDHSSMLADAMSEVFQSLQDELSIKREGVAALSPDMQLPPHTNELAEKLRHFPTELTEKEA